MSYASMKDFTFYINITFIQHSKKNNHQLTIMGSNDIKHKHKYMTIIAGLDHCKIEVSTNL